MSVRVVVDTSSLVPAALRRDLHQAADGGQFTALWSPWIIAELNRVLTWRWVAAPATAGAVPDLSLANWRRCRTAANRMMSLLLSCFEVVTPVPPYPAPWAELADEGDHPIWAAAVTGRATYVISENRHHYPPADAEGRHRYQAIEHVSGATFLARLNDGRA